MTSGGRIKRGFEFFGKFGLYKPDFHSIEKFVVFTCDDKGVAWNMYSSIKKSVIQRHPSKENCLIARYSHLLISASIEGDNTSRYVMNFVMELGNYPRTSIFPFSGVQSGLYFDGGARVLTLEEYPPCWANIDKECVRYKPPDHVLRHMLVVDTKGSKTTNRKIMIGKGDY